MSVVLSHWECTTKWKIGHLINKNNIHKYDPYSILIYLTSNFTPKENKPESLFPNLDKNSTVILSVVKEYSPVSLPAMITSAYLEVKALILVQVHPSWYHLT